MGITTRNYNECQDTVPGIDTFRAGKSNASRRFVQETSKRMKEFISRGLDDIHIIIIATRSRIWRISCIGFTSSEEYRRKKVLGIKGAVRT